MAENESEEVGQTIQGYKIKIRKNYHILTLDAQSKQKEDVRHFWLENKLDVEEHFKTRKKEFKLVAKVKPSDKTIKFTGFSTNSVTVNVVALDEANPIPEMLGWVKINRNVHAPDEYYLTHLPPVPSTADDYLIEKFHQEINKSHTDGVLTDRECGILNDDMLFRLVSRVKKVIIEDNFYFLLSMMENT